MKRSLWFALFMMMAGAISACGPIDYLNTVTRKATRALADAKAANAEQLAPYEYWTGVTYLNMAREKASYADYMIAVDYGERSEAASLKAKGLASKTGAEGPSAERDTHAPAEVINTPSSGDGAAAESGEGNK